MNTIVGIHSTGQIFIDGVELTPGRSQAIYNHSPNGFAWGYSGSGPSQLALALCLLYLSPTDAFQVYQKMKEIFVASLPQDDFCVHYPLDERIFELHKQKGDTNA